MEKSLHIQQLEILLERLPRTHAQRSRIEEDLARHLAGYYGEKALAYPLSFLQKNQYTTKYNIRVQEDRRYFQMDLLVISKQFIVIVEVKNIMGTLFFDQTHQQLIRTHEQKERGFSDPISQVKRQQMQFTNWLQKHQFPPIPIIPRVVISNPSTIIKSQESLDEVIHAHALVSNIEQLAQTYQQKRWNTSDITRLMTLLAQQHTPLVFNILKKYGISKQDITTGIYCSNCKAHTVEKQYRAWICHRCQATFQDAHLRALRDYALIFGPAITNREMREFLGIGSIHIAGKILKSLNLPSTGKLRYRVYQLQTPQ